MPEQVDKNASKTRRCAALHGQRLWRGRFLLDERVATAVASITTFNTPARPSPTVPMSVPPAAAARPAFTRSNNPPSVAAEKPCAPPLTARRPAQADGASSLRAARDYASEPHPGALVLVRSFASAAAARHEARVLAEMSRPARGRRNPPPLPY